MMLDSIVRKLQLAVLTPFPAGTEVKAGYVSDLLSDVLGNAAAGSLWVTVQCHPNVIAVASLLDLAAVLLVAGTTPNEATLTRARESSVALLATELSAFEAVGQLYQLGIRGCRR